MKYLGSKRRVSKKLLEVMLPHRTPDQAWVEPFVGGANMIDKVNGVRIGCDNNHYLIELFKAIQNGWIPPENCSEDEYNKIKINKDSYPAYLVGFIGFGCSFGANFLGTYARDKKSNRQNFCRESKNNILKQSENIKNVKFVCCDYKDLYIPNKSFIYCDPPYRGTTKYHTSKNFDHNEFWEWCRQKKAEGHTVFVSETSAPEDFECVKEVEISSAICNYSITNTKKRSRIERLFTI